MRVPPFPPPLSDIRCVINDTEADVTWNNDAIYDEIVVRRRGPGQGLFVEVARLPGSATSYTETASNPGTYEWEIRATIGEQISDSTTCAATRS